MPNGKNKENLRYQFQCIYEIIVYHTSFFVHEPSEMMRGTLMMKYPLAKLHPEKIRLASFRKTQTLIISI